MEQKLVNIINSLEKFILVDFNKDVNINDSMSSNSYIVQLQNNNHNIENDLRNFDIRADILITYDNEQINIYTKISEKYVDIDIQNLINILLNEFPVKNIMSNGPNIIRFDTFNLESTR